MFAAPQPGGRYGPKIGQQRGGPGLVFFVGRQQHGGGIAVPVLRGLGQLKGFFHLLPPGVVPGRRQHCADVPIEQLTVESGGFAVHPLRRAVAGAVGRGDRSHRKADAAAADGGQHPCQRVRRQQKQHALGGLFHHLQQGVGGFLVHLFHVVQQHGTALGGKAGVEDLRPHGLHLADEVFPARAHARHGDGLPDDARLHPAAVAVAGLAHGAAAFAP